MKNKGDTVGSLTQLQKSVIIGSILGDGCLRKIPGRSHALLEVNHSIKAKDYVDWKYSILKDISKSKPKSRKGNGGRIAYRFLTRQHKELSELQTEFYAKSKKRIPDSLEIDEISLAVWFMDDGSKCRERDAYLNTQQYSIDDQLKLIKILRRLGLQASLNRDKSYYRIRFAKDSIGKLNQLVAKYMVATMRYKLSHDPVET